MVDSTTSRKCNDADPSCRETADVLTYHRQIRATLNEAKMAAQRILFRLRQWSRGIMAPPARFPYGLRRFSSEGGNLHADPLGVRVDVRFDAFNTQRFDSPVRNDPFKNGVD